MKLYIPKIGESIILKKDWIFPLYDEHRNESLADVLGAKISWRPAANVTKLCDANIAAGTELTVDRIYVRQDADDFASVTFLVKKHQDNSFVGCRFWAKLEDVNSIEFDPGTSDNICGFGAAAKLKRLAQEAENPDLAEKRKKKKQAKEELEFARACAAKKVHKLHPKLWPYTPVDWSNQRMVDKCFPTAYCKKTVKNGDGSKTRYISFTKFSSEKDDSGHKKYGRREITFATTTKGKQQISVVETDDSGFIADNHQHFRPHFINYCK